MAPRVYSGLVTLIGDALNEVGETFAHQRRGQQCAVHHGFKTVKFGRVGAEHFFKETFFSENAFNGLAAFVRPERHIERRFYALFAEKIQQDGQAVLHALVSINVHFKYYHAFPFIKTARRINPAR